jgi:toxin ParE1/3/4
MSRVEVSERARADLGEIWEYIATDNVSAADKYLAEIDDGFRALAESPRMGRARDDIAPGFRYFPVGNHLILYCILDNGVGIVRVVHAARRLEDLL